MENYNPFTEIQKRLDQLTDQVSGMQTNSEWMTLDEVCDYLNLSKSSIYKLTMKNGIPFYKLGRILKFKRAEVDEWIESHRVTKLSIQGIVIEE